jgi:hypothetical protein
VLKLVYVCIYFLEEFGAVGVKDVRFFMTLFYFFVSLDGSDVMFESGMLNVSERDA